MERRSESAVKPDMTRPIADKTRAPGFEHCKEAWGATVSTDITSIHTKAQTGFPAGQKVALILAP